MVDNVEFVKENCCSPTNLNFGFCSFREEELESAAKETFDRQRGFDRVEASTSPVDFSGFDEREKKPHEEPVMGQKTSEPTREQLLQQQLLAQQMYMAAIAQFFGLPYGIPYVQPNDNQHGSNNVASSEYLNGLQSQAGGHLTAYTGAVASPPPGFSNMPGVNQQAFQNLFRVCFPLYK